MNVVKNKLYLNLKNDNSVDGADKDFDCLLNNS